MRTIEFLRKDCFEVTKVFENILNTRMELQKVIGPDIFE